MHVKVRTEAELEAEAMAEVEVEAEIEAITEFVAVVRAGARTGTTDNGRVATGSMTAALTGTTPNAIMIPFLRYSIDANIRMRGRT